MPTWGNPTSTVGVRSFEGSAWSGAWAAAVGRFSESGRPSLLAARVSGLLGFRSGTVNHLLSSVLRYVI